MSVSEEKQSVLLDLLGKLSHEISILLSKLENDHENISEAKFREYEKQIEKLQYIHNELNEEVVFS